MHTIADFISEFGDRETYEFEFKHGGELRSLDDTTKGSIAKDVSAFANAGGGVLAYGISENRVGPDSFVKDFDPVTNSKITTDQLTQIIRFQTSPPLSNFEVGAFPVGTGHVFVVRVGRGDTAHQCKHDLKYYHRVGATNQPMHDSEIRDVMGRRTAALVTADIALGPRTGPVGAVTRLITPSLINDGSLTAQYWALKIYVPEAVCGYTPDHANLVMERSPEHIHPKHRVFEFHSERGPLGQATRLLPGQTTVLGQSLGFARIWVLITEDSYHSISTSRPSIFFTLYVDNCPPKTQEIGFSEWCDF